MVGKIIWPAAIVAFGVDLLADLAFHNPALNLATFSVVFVVVALARHRCLATSVSRLEREPQGEAMRFSTRGRGVAVTNSGSAVRDVPDVTRKLREKYPSCWDTGERLASMLFESADRPTPRSEEEIQRIVRGLAPIVVRDFGTEMANQAGGPLKVEAGVMTALEMGFGSKLTSLLTDALRTGR